MSYTHRGAEAVSIRFPVRITCHGGSSFRAGKLQRYAFQTMLTVAILQNASRTPDDSARLTSVELAEKAITTPTTANAEAAVTGLDWSHGVLDRLTRVGASGKVEEGRATRALDPTLRRHRPPCDRRHQRPGRRSGAHHLIHQSPHHTW